MAKGSRETFGLRQWLGERKEKHCEFAEKQGCCPATESFLHGDLESGLLEGRTDGASTVHGRSDHRGAEGARGRGEDGGSGAQAWRVGSDALQLEGQVRRHGCLRGQTAEAARGRERQTEEAFGRADVGWRRASRASVKKMVGPVVKREGVAHLRATMGLSERRACSIVSADRKMVRYRSCRPPDTELRTQLRGLANERGVSDIVGCSSCCGRRANPRASTASTGFIAKKASRCASDGLGGAPGGRGRRSWSNPSRTLAGRWISSMTSLPAAGGSGSVLNCVSGPVVDHARNRSSNMIAN